MRYIVEEHETGFQTVVATHSIDILIGALEARNSNMTVIRLQRNGLQVYASALSPSEIINIWSDPVLRYSNALNGLFHDKVVICESDGDCRFYNAIADAMRAKSEHSFARDILFVPAGGKAAIPKLFKALKTLTVPVCAAVDFDALSERGVFKALLEVCEADFDNVKGDYDIVCKEIATLGQKSASDTRDAIRSELESVDGSLEQFPSGKAKAIREHLKPASGWARAKRTGLGILSPGRARTAGLNLLENLASHGLFVVPSGELESFVETEEREKNEWVRSVLTTFSSSLAEATALENARSFVTRLITI